MFATILSLTDPTACFALPASAMYGTLERSPVG